MGGDGKLVKSYDSWIGGGCAIIYFSCVIFGRVLLHFTSGQRTTRGRRGGAGRKNIPVQKNVEEKDVEENLGLERKWENTVGDSTH